MEEEKIEQNTKLNESDAQSDSLPLSTVNDGVSRGESKPIVESAAREVRKDDHKVVIQSNRKSPQTLRSLQTEYPAIDKAVYLVLTFALSMFFLFMSYSTVWVYPWQSDWGVATGKITGIVQGNKLWRHVYYTYEANHHPYTYHQDFQCYGYFVSPGESVTVRYRPDAPGIAVIQTGANPVTFFYLTAGLLLLMAFAGGVSDGFKTPLKSLGLHDAPNRPQH